MLTAVVSAVAGETNDASRALADHITSTHRLVIVDTNHVQTAWSDGAILEAATNFPAPIGQLILNPSRYHPITSYFDQLNVTEKGVWRQAKMTIKNKDGLRTVATADGSVKMLVNSVYLDYACQRHTNATLWVKSPFDPVAVRVGTQVCIAIMTTHPELRGKPGTGVRAVAVTNVNRYRGPLRSQTLHT